MRRGGDGMSPPFLIVSRETMLKNTGLGILQSLYEY